MNKWDSVEYTSKEAWFEHAENIFGTSDYREWRWVCPACNRIQKMDEFEPFKDDGASPNSVYSECLGRYNGGRKGPYKCDWAAYGLFSGPDFVMHNGEKQPVFKFASPVNNNINIKQGDGSVFTSGTVHGNIKTNG